MHEASRDTFPPDGQEVIEGAVSSFSVTVKEQELVLPAASVAVSVTSWDVLFPLSTVPAAGVCVSVVPLQLSVTVAVYAGIVYWHVASRDTFVLVGQEVIEGAMSSMTLTLKLQVDELLC